MNTAAPPRTGAPPARRTLPLLDRTRSLFREGYRFLANRRTAFGDDMFDVRVIGRHATVLSGEGGARVFYDGRVTRRHGAVPLPVRATLFGLGTLHGIDGAEHLQRKALFVRLLSEEETGGFEDTLISSWRSAAAVWPDDSRIVLFDEAAHIMWRAVSDWAGIPSGRLDERRMVEALVAAVDGFATPTRPYLRALAGRVVADAELTQLIEEVREGLVDPPAGSALGAWACFTGTEGQPLPARIAARELLNVLRPTVATAWLVAFTGHALIEHPEWRERLRGRAVDDPMMTAFAEEVRRYYPFTPFLGARAVRSFRWRDRRVPAGRLLLLDVHGTDHDPDLWPRPEQFDPDRFAGREPGTYELLAQGGGDVATGHRCPGEAFTLASIRVAARMLATEWDFAVPHQDLTIPLDRMPTRPRSGVVLEGLRTVLPPTMATVPSVEQVQQTVRGVSPA